MTVSRELSRYRLDLVGVQEVRWGEGQWHRTSSRIQILRLFKPTIRNERLHEISNDNVVSLVNFATSKNLIVKSSMFPHHNIHKYTWTAPDGASQNQIGHILIGG
jgi:hypothetical protein